jgi:hypothetical protein
MPRARCHWALLIQTRDALRERLPGAYRVVAAHPTEFFAGGVAPDAIRLFAGRDKLSSHFYDDQREETWDRVAEAMCAAQPAVADPSRLEDPALAWILGYLTHILTDVAYWRHVIARLPRFPQEAGIHHGAWVLADQFPIPRGERGLDVEALRFDAAPPWVDEAAMRSMLGRIVERILAVDGMWPVELSYVRYRPELAGKSDAEALAVVLPEWEANVAAARALLPPDVWERFRLDAVEGAAGTIEAYLACTFSPRCP